MSIQATPTRRPSPQSLDERVAARTSDRDPMAERILDAAQQRFLLVGIRRTTMDDIAEAAGLGRATLYRRFAGRDDIVLATIAREFERFAHAVEEQMHAFDDPRERFVEGFVAIVHAAHTHPLLRRLLEVDPDLVLPFLTKQGEVILRFNRTFLADHLRDGQRYGVIGDHLDPDEVAEFIVRVCHSLLLTPTGMIEAGDRERLRCIAQRYLAPILFDDDQR